MNEQNVENSVGYMHDKRREELLKNIESIIAYLQVMPGVTAIDIQEPQERHVWEKKVFVLVAGYDEPVCLEIY